MNKGLFFFVFSSSSAGQEVGAVQMDKIETNFSAGSLFDQFVGMYSQ